MDVEVVEARPEEKPVLDNLLQLYLYDWSEMLGADVSATGRFEHVFHRVGSLDGYWTAPGRHAFLVKVDGKLAGFALVIEQSHLSGNSGTTDMDEFFIMRKYRRRGVGREAATRIFNLFPGRWEVREVVENVGAQVFWRKVIGEYTGGRYEEQLIDDERWHGPAQFFESKRSP